MGCFDSNCCITGLPITYKDPIKMGLISSVSEDHVCHVGDAYQFWTLPISGRYNDYGSIEEIPDEDQQLMDIFINLLKPGFRDHEEYSRKFFEDNHRVRTSIDYWNALSSNDIEYDPEREIRYARNEWIKNGSKEEEKPEKWFLMGYLKEPVKFCPWMCHEWAWNELLNQSKRNKFPYPAMQEQLTNFFMTYDELEKLEETKKWRIRTSDFYYLFGDQAGLHETLRELIRDSNEEGVEYSEYFKQKFIETLQFCSSMYLIRKNIIPMTTVGMQHEDFSYLLSWTKLVAEKAQEHLDKRLEQ